MSKTKSSHKVIAVFLTLNFLLSIVPVNQIFANNNGPNAAEASGFEPVSASDMVNLSSGDMAYVLPLLEIDGFPVTLSYHAGIPMDMESSWVGLGWNINTGAITRGVVANPDDWSNGKRLNLTFLEGKQDSYSVNVGVGMAKAAEVGVGLSWGPNKSLSGSVSASVGPLSANIDTNGNYGLGIGSGIFSKGVFGKALEKVGSGVADKSSPFGASLSISGNVNGGGISANIGVGGSSKYISGGMGVSISGKGVGGSYSIGGNNNQQGTDAQGGGASISVNSFSAGDYSYNSKGFYIPLQLGVLSFGFGFNRTTITLDKAFQKYGFGVLYHDDVRLYDDLNTNLGEDAPDSGQFSDYKKRNEYGDVYEQILPQQEEEFIGDYRNQIERLNFTFNGYDSYNIDANGVGGTLRPIVGDNTTLIGEGYDGNSTRINQLQVGVNIFGQPIYETLEKTKVFYHHGGSTNVQQQNSIGTQDLHFVFDGQITENAVMNNSDINNITGSNLSFSQFINKGVFSVNGRPKAGSYVEVYTNDQIDNDANGRSLGLLTPSSLYVDGTPNNDLKRIDQGYMPGGIGGYKITTPDGKVYHFSQPVYHYEQIQHNFMNFEGTESTNNTKFNSSTKREATPYATHWLLSAITGPDFIDVNNNNFADEEDYGYWVRLDHGQWSNAYTWRSPYDNDDYTQDVSLPSNSPLRTRRHYATFVDREVEKSDPGYFLQGRKDLYYLDKIVSKTQTAYFVKDLRYDAVGTNAPYKYFNNTDREFPDPLEGNAYVSESAIYDTEYQLRLDQIIIVNNKNNTNITSSNNNNVLEGFSPVNLTDRYLIGSLNRQSYFKEHLPLSTQTHRLHQSQNIIDVEDVQGFDYRNAQKVIKFNHDYSLASKTPSSGWTKNNSSTYSANSQAGRLTLNSVKTFGRGLFDGATKSDLYDYLPPYRFTYHKPDLPHEENELIALGPQYNLTVFGNLKPDAQQFKLDRANKDNWGFRNAELPNENGVLENSIDAWSLKSIKTPQGAVISVEYEEDDFYIEAFSRRYWENNLKFMLQDIDSNYFRLLVEVQDGLNIENDVNFQDYFDPNKEVFMDYWACINANPAEIQNNDNTAELDITVNNTVEIETVSPTQLALKILKTSGMYITDDESLINKWVAKTDLFGLKYRPRARGLCPSNPNLNATPHLNLLYKLLSNKIAPGTSGGGLRVKSIAVDNNEGQKFITSYDYTDPNTGETSGITSFNPVHGEVFVPYQNELPGPGVMYEWVTMTAKSLDQNGVENQLGNTRYHYYTLKPVIDIFNPNIDMPDPSGNGNYIFRTTVEEPTMALENVTAKKMNIQKDLSKIGQLISTEEFNSHGQLINKSKNFYTSRDGELSETFSAMKSVFDYDEDDDGNVTGPGLLIQRYMAQSTKSEKVSVVNRIENVSGGLKNIVSYEDADDYLGTYRTSIRTMADGTVVKEEKFPAYLNYPNMGSKITDPSNKNMLTQEAMSTTSVKIDNQWWTTNANVTTWNNDWTYRDNRGAEYTPPTDGLGQNDLIWRKHRNYVWKGNVDDNGTYGQKLSPNDFNWGLSDTQTNPEWQKISEITRYTRWSAAVETQDINGNFVSSKMADNFKKTTASGNASYTEMFYSGAEYVDNSHESEVVVFNANTEKVHTGKYSSKVFSGGGTFVVILKANEHKQGKYKISVWVDKENVENARINVKNTIMEFNGERINAGNWVQLNHYEDLSSDQEIIFVTSINGEVYFDDFRVHPIYASMNSYVYDHDTDQLTHIIDANNMATEFRYDDAGRLCKTYKEVFDTNDFVGGFKKANQYKYNYKDVPITSCQCCDDEVIDFKPIAIDDNATTQQGISKSIPVTNNDNFGGDGASSSAITITAQPSNGFATVDNAGTTTDPTDDFIVYDPNTSFLGQDTLQYQICDSDGDCDIADVVIDVTALPPLSAMPPDVNFEFGDPLHEFSGSSGSVTGGSGNYNYQWAYTITGEPTLILTPFSQGSFTLTYNPFTYEHCNKTIVFTLTITDTVTNEELVFNSTPRTILCDQI